ncbi:MAG: OsmC family protein [Longimicrobiales bacterium]
MTGTFGGALEARGIGAGEGLLSGHVRGEVGKEDGVLVIRRIHVTYRLRAGEEHRETVERVHAMHADRCPVYKTLKDAIEITTEFVLDP